MTHRIEVEGTITEVYDDLGPTTYITVLQKNGQTCTFDVSDMPVGEAWFRDHIGRRIRLLVEIEVLK